MVLHIAISSILGLIFGFLYGCCFVEKFKKLYKKQDSEKKIIFKITVFSMLAHVALIISFLFLIFWLSANILVVLLFFMVAFWGYVLLYAK
jgi:hypothetical protein